MTTWLALCAWMLISPAPQQNADEHRFTLASEGEVVATISAGCGACDWAIAGQEAVVARISVDSIYSQHLIITRGEAPAPYRVMLGSLTAGEHRLTIERDTERSSKSAGALKIKTVDVRAYAKGSPEQEWLAHAPFLYARPGTVERFSDVPLLMWVERAPAPAQGFRYSVIFTHEDGGTPTDRLMATWGRTTDIEFVIGRERAPDGTEREEIQAKDHEILPFKGKRFGSHPLLWVATDNNMVADSGPDTIRFAPAPELISLDNVSREVVMDRNAWTFAVMAAELRREGRIDPAGQPGSAKIPDPRRFAYLEACAQLEQATLAFDVGVSKADGTIEWYQTDRGDARFRIARNGCVRVAVPVAEGVTGANLAGVRIRAFTRPRRDGEPVLPPGTGRVRLSRLNGVFMLDGNYRPGTPRLHWTGTIAARGEAAPVPVPVPPSAPRKH
ncbi:MAG: hypothetical protein ABIS06_20180 [Vicinamibacterales bacterium]